MVTALSLAASDDRPNPSISSEDKCWGPDEREREKMLLLEPHNLLIQTILTEKFAARPPTGVDQVITDFDNVQFHLSNPAGPDDKPIKTIIHLSMLIKCYSDLLQYCARDVLQREYGPMIIAPEQGYDFTIQINLDNPPSSPGIRPHHPSATTTTKDDGPVICALCLIYLEALDKLIKNIALIKRNALAAPFEKAFAAHADLHKAAPKSLEGAHAAPTQDTADLIAIHYREEEAIYISPASDRVTVIFSTVFREEVDHIFGEVFLREFVDARKRPALQNAPQVLFSNREPPLEIRPLPEIQKALNSSRAAGKGEIGYITFGMTPSDPVVGC